METDDANTNSTSNDSYFLDIANILKADAVFSQQVLVIYIPDHDQFGVEIGNQRYWVLEAVKILAEIGGGVSMQPVEGVWVDDSGNMIWENTVKVYTYIKQNLFVEKINTLKKFVNRFGNETNQREVFVEFDNDGYKIRNFNE